MFFTHVAIICNIPTIQPLLPPVIFVGAHSITAAEWSEVCRDLPGNVFVKRMPKGWNNADQHRIIVRILGMPLAPFMDLMQPILYVDPAPLHLHPAVLTELAAAGIWFHVIPAMLTLRLQPLDSHGFVLFKHLKNMDSLMVCVEAYTRP